MFCQGLIEQLEKMLFVSYIIPNKNTRIITTNTFCTTSEAKDLDYKKSCTSKPYNLGSFELNFSLSSSRTSWKELGAVFLLRTSEPRHKYKPWHLLPDVPLLLVLKIKVKKLWDAVKTSAWQNCKSLLKWRYVGLQTLQTPPAITDSHTWPGLSWIFA